MDDQNTDRPASPSPLKILVVDDKADSAKMLSLLLQLDGHDARPAFGGVEGLEAAKSFAPDVVFLDLGLPVMDGYQVAEEIRRISALRHTMLVALTGYGPGEFSGHHQQSRFDHHLLKPAEMADIKNLLAQAAQRKAAALGGAGVAAR